MQADSYLCLSQPQNLNLLHSIVCEGANVEFLWGSITITSAINHRIGHRWQSILWCFALSYYHWSIAIFPTLFNQPVFINAPWLDQMLLSVGRYRCRLLFQRLWSSQPCASRGVKVAADVEELIKRIELMKTFIRVFLAPSPCNLVAVKSSHTLFPLLPPPVLYQRFNAVFAYLQLSSEAFLS